MLIYLILMLIATGGIGALVYRHRIAIFSVSEGVTRQPQPTFALFMQDSMAHFVRLWNDYLKVQLLKILEKNLRRVRIMTLRIEQSLFRMTHRVKNIAERAEEAKAESAASEAASQDVPPSVQ